MAEDEDEDEPAVALGDDAPVDGAPISRVASRISWPQGESDIVAAEGETAIRTPEGPRQLADILPSCDRSYFARRQEFEGDVREIIGYGPIPSADDRDGEDGEGEGDDSDGD